MDLVPGELTVEQPAVGLIAWDAEVPDDLLPRLRREVVAVELVELGRGRGAGAVPAHRVLLAWLPASAPWTDLRALVAYRDRAPAPAMLIGWSPEGDAAATELALAAGFDDFVAGRGSVRELAGRLGALARRLPRTTTAGHVLRFGAIAIDFAQHRVWERGALVPVTRTELAVMAALVRAQGRALTRSQLLDRAWNGPRGAIGERTVDNTVARIRRKLRDPRVLVTVRGRGFRLGA